MARAGVDRLLSPRRRDTTYNCALEDRPWRCPTALAMLDAHPGLERIASGLWQGKDTRLYRIR